MSEREIPVLIVGGGPIGLALAIELGREGIACELVEQGDGVVLTPKMNEVNTRTMEFCRRWDVVDQVLDTPFPLDYPKDVAFVTSLAGYELGRVVRPPRKVRSSEHSPEITQTCSQHWFDPILRRLASSLPSVSLRYMRRLDSFVETATGVIATITDMNNGATETVRAQYLAGCDGAGSTVRRGLGINLVGQGTIGHAVNMFFRAPKLLEICGKEPGVFFLNIDKGGAWANLRIIDPVKAIWRLMVNETDPGVRADNIDREAYLRRALGREIEVEWIDVNVWHRRSAVADHYGKGRVFVAGDAVHQVSPTGALGMNTGMGDAVDLSWKLVATLQGWGGAALADTYDAERRPIGERNVRMATAFHTMQSNLEDDLSAIAEPGPEGDARRTRIGAALVTQLGREFRTIGLQIGYRYEDSPICVPDGTPATPDDPEFYHPSARPGMRAPHVWLKDGRSILDLFERGFTLLRFDAALDVSAMETAAARRGIPFRSVALDEPAARLLYETRLVLVRPDGHVAWRGDDLPADPGAILDRARGALIPV